jgi:hypothetical protein
VLVQVMQTPVILILLVFDTSALGNLRDVLSRAIAADTEARDV